MIVNGSTFKKAPFQDIGWLIEQTEAFYREKIKPAGALTPFSAAVPRIVDHRGWKPSLPLIRANLQPILEELAIFYVPKQMLPGPCILFPNFDIHGNPVLGKINPFYELDFGSGPVKYDVLGTVSTFLGPVWLGNSDRVIEKIIQTRTVGLVEGPYDLLACRVLMPEAPILSTGSKNFSPMHLTHLRLLGVEEIVLMFDNEVTKSDRPGALGAGNTAMQKIAKKMKADFPHIAVRQQLLPNSDPSECLKTLDHALALQGILENYFSQNF